MLMTNKQPDLWSLLLCAATIRFLFCTCNASFNFISLILSFNLISYLTVSITSYTKKIMGLMFVSLFNKKETCFIYEVHVTQSQSIGF